MTLSELRIALAHAKDRLRTAKTDLETAKTIATMETKGANAEERKKADAQALLDDQNYNKALAHLHTCEYEADRIEAEIDILKDERTARELACRERNNEALDRYAAALERLASQRPVTMAVDAALPF